MWVSKKLDFKLLNLDLNILRETFLFPLESSSYFSQLSNSEQILARVTRILGCLELINTFAN